MSSRDRVNPNTFSPGVVVYWRPGCGFCSALFRNLDQAGVVHERVDIWSDDKARAFVRSVARGNETVPTVTIGSVSIVNPSLNEVLAVAAVQAPGAVPDGHGPLRPGRVAKAFARLLGT